MNKIKNPPSQYCIGEQVFVRSRPHGKTGEKKLSLPKVKKAVVVKKNKDGTCVLVSINGTRNWVTVEDVTSLTHDKEKNRKKLAKGNVINQNY